MVNARILQQDCSSFLKGERVIAAGVFVVNVEDFAKEYVAPVAVGAGVGIAVDVVETLAGFDADVVAAVAGTAAMSRTRHEVFKREAQKQGLTPVMICAITEKKIYLLNWDGNVRSGNGPSRILLEFRRAYATIHESKKMAVTTTLVISENGSSAAIQANFGLLAPNKTMNKDVIKELQKSGRKRM